MPRKKGTISLRQARGTKIHGRTLFEHLMRPSYALFELESEEHDVFRSLPRECRRLWICIEAGTASVICKRSRGRVFTKHVRALDRKIKSMFGIELWYTFTPALLRELREETEKNAYRMQYP